MTKNRIDRLLTFNLPLAIMVVCTVFPLYWTLNTAFKPEGDIIKRPIQYLPKNPTVDNFVNAWTNVGFSTYFKNSLLVGVCTVLIVIVLSILSGYALSRYKFKGKRAFLLMLLSTQFIPRSMLIIPLFIIFKHLGLI